MTNDQQSLAFLIIYYVVSSVIMHIYVNMDLTLNRKVWIFEDYFFACFVVNMLVTPFLLIWCLGKLITFAIMSIIGVK